MKLNLGCGFKKKEGYVNVDKFSGCMPDKEWDLTQAPWPFEDSSCEEARFEYSLEEMGETKKDLFAVLKELYRVMKPSGTVYIRCRHPRHDRFLQNPICVHRMSPEFFKTLSVQQNLDLLANGVFETPLGFELGVNFQLDRFKYLLDPTFEAQMNSGEITEEQIRERMRFEYNICQSLEMGMLALKAEEATVNSTETTSLGSEVSL